MPVAAACRANAPFVQLLCNRHHAERPVGQNAANNWQDIRGMAICLGLLRAAA
jgi:hypothetical protein